MSDGNRDLITDEGRQAARTVAQWELGDPAWAGMLLGIATAPDPKFTAESHFEEEYQMEFEGIWRDNE